LGRAIDFALQTDREFIGNRLNMGSRRDKFLATRIELRNLAHSDSS
jgi:hypothetical protein